MLIAKPGTWFKAGTHVELIDDYRPHFDCGLFRGVRVCEDLKAEGEHHAVGDEYVDEEVCYWDEFDEVLDKQVNG